MCGKPLSPGDRKVWQQAIALLMGLKVRNDIGEKDLAGAVETALHHSAGGGKQYHNPADDEPFRFY